jgi:hypothetical protein
MSGFLSRRFGVIAAAAALMAVAAGGTAYALSASSPAHIASLTMAGRSQAALKITGGTPVLDVSFADLHGALLRASTPDGAPIRPVLSGSAPIVLSLASAGTTSGSKGDAVTVVLSSAVVWSLDFAAGTQRTDADLRGGRVGGIAVTAGSDILDVSLPRPSGTLPFLLAGGVSQFLISLPGGVPTRVTVGGGASYVSGVGSQDLTGIAGGTVLTPPGWATAPSRLDIDATSGFSRLTISSWNPAGS